MLSDLRKNHVRKLGCSTDINRKETETLEEFVSVLAYGDPKQIKTENVIDQRRLLGHLSSLLSPDDGGMGHDLFIRPVVKEFFARLITGLDDTLEVVAGEVFQVGWVCCMSHPIGPPDALQVILGLMDALSMRFPQLQMKYEQHLEDLLAAFITPTIGEFVDRHPNSMGRLLADFPLVCELFVSPVTDSNAWKEQRLFNFYCNPWVFNPILKFLTRPDDQGSPSGSHLQGLENKLRRIRLFTNDKSWHEFATKCSELLKQSGQLEPFADGCLGLFGEIQAAYYFAKNVCRAGDELIFLPDDNRGGKKEKRENCDLMIIRDNGQVVDLAEVKAKSPRHGVEDCDAAADDFFSNFGPAISSYLDYLDCYVKPIFGLSLKRVLPQFWMYEGSDYGVSLPVVSDAARAYFKAPPSKMKSDNRIEGIVRQLFMRPLVLRNGRSIGCNEVRFAVRCRFTADLFQKDCIKGVLQKAVDQLLEAGKRQKQEDHHISKLYVVLYLSLSSRLLRDPFSRDEGGIDFVAAKELDAVVKPFKEKVAQWGWELELIPLQSASR